MVLYNHIANVPKGLIKFETFAVLRQNIIVDMIKLLLKGVDGRIIWLENVYLCIWKMDFVNKFCEVLKMDELWKKD